MIYLDYAATTPLCEEAFQAMLPFLQNQYANASGSYAAAREARYAIDHAKKKTAALIGAEASELYITSGGTEADNWALLGIMRAVSPDKRHLIVSSIEHHAILKACHALEKEGFSVTYAPVDSNGVVDIEAIRKAISPQTAMISVMLANNEVGTLQPIGKIAELAHSHECLMHTDAVQAVGHISVCVNSLNVDLLSLSAHKFYGPKGVGALYIRKGTRIDRLFHGGEQEKGMRAGTENVAGIVGMGAAAEMAASSLDRDERHLLELRELMIGMVREQLKGVTINGLGAQRLPGHVHMTIEHADTALVLMQLDMNGIAASAGSACASGVAERSSVMKAMGIVGDQQADLRLTFGRQNTKEDVVRTIEVLKSILNQ